MYEVFEDFYAFAVSPSKSSGLNPYPPRYPYTSTFENSHAPSERNRIAIAAMTSASKPSEYCETWVKAPRRPSTPYERGLMKAIHWIQKGAEVSGKSAPERKNSGILTRLTMSPKPCMSSMVEAMAVPKAVNTSAIENMNRSPQRTAAMSGRKPIATVMRSTITPWMVAVVAPPKVRPNMMAMRETGATMVSLRKPNWRSQMSSMPEKTAENMMRHGDDARRQELDVVAAAGLGEDRAEAEAERHQE